MPPTPSQGRHGRLLRQRRLWNTDMELSAKMVIKNRSFALLNYLITYWSMKQRLTLVKGGCWFFSKWKAPSPAAKLFPILMIMDFAEEKINLFQARCTAEANSIPLPQAAKVVTWLVLNKWVDKRFHRKILVMPLHLASCRCLAVIFISARMLFNLLCQ